MAIDLQQNYKNVQDKINSVQSYLEAKQGFDETVKKAGDSLEQSKNDIVAQLNEARQQLNGYQSQIKDQFSQLLDVSKLTGGKGANSIKYLKKILIKTVNVVRPEIEKILMDEVINALGCDQQQAYVADPNGIFIKLKSVDLRGFLRLDPESKVGKILYERGPLVYQSRPFQMNKELYQRIQSSQSFSADTGALYIGASGQPLFDIQYFDVNPQTGQAGGWYKVTLVNRANNVNKVYQFLKDYYKSVRIFDPVNFYASLMDALTGAVSIEGQFGIDLNGDITKFSLWIQRILGLCFDNDREIDISGISKIAELDDIDDSFFELTEVDLRNIERKVDNIQNGVMEFEDCDNLKLPVNSAAIVDSLNEMLLIENEIDLDSFADGLTGTLTNDPKWTQGIGLNLNAMVKASVDLNFIKLLVDGLIKAIFSPKIVLPLITMYKAIKLPSVANPYADDIGSYTDFVKKFRRLIINMVSRIGAIFVRELFNIIKRDLFNIIQSVVKDLVKEKADKRIIMILKLTQLLIVAISFIKDWRRCKSVVDELLKLLTIATSGTGSLIFGKGDELPNPLLLLSKFLDGYSATRAFIGTIQELQQLGIPTGNLPDGSPNLDLLSKFGLLKAQSKEFAENSKIDSVVIPAQVFPNGSTSYTKAFGKVL